VAVVIVTVKYSGKQKKIFHFLKILEKPLNDVIPAVFVVFVVFEFGIFTSSFFVEFASYFHILIFNLLLCMALQTSILGLYLLSNMATENNGNPLKTKFEKIEKQNVDFC